jgi:hypothetical protein
MKLTIIRVDGAVYKDGISYSGLDLSTVPADVHALQFNDIANKGWIEFINSNDGTKPQNEPIISLPAWAAVAMVKWDEAKVAEEAAEALAAKRPQPQTTGTQTA